MFLACLCAIVIYKAARGRRTLKNNKNTGKEIWRKNLETACGLFDFFGRLWCGRQVLQKIFGYLRKKRGGAGSQEAARRSCVEPASIP